mmetsp:Transcript_22924/g.40798  ORF Transcript_22924/g.40798 Transcript_22924/m.40798 type:complete len:219 (-) Transcript_22924:158-814(-)
MGYYMLISFPPSFSPVNFVTRAPRHLLSRGPAVALGPLWGAAIAVAATGHALHHPFALHSVVILFDLDQRPFLEVIPIKHFVHIYLASLDDAQRDHPHFILGVAQQPFQPFPPLPDGRLVVDIVSQPIIHRRAVTVPTHLFHHNPDSNICHEGGERLGSFILGRVPAKCVSRDIHPVAIVPGLQRQDTLGRRPCPLRRRRWSQVPTQRQNATHTIAGT